MADQPDVNTLLAQLEAERAELDLTIARIRRFLMLPDSNGVSSSSLGGTTSASSNVGRDSPVTGRVRPDEFFRLTQREAIIKYLNIMKQPQSPASIVNGLKAGGVLTNAKKFYANINTELKRMKKRGLVVNTPSGWGLAEWYPQKPKQLELDKPRKKKKKSAGHGRAKGAKVQTASAEASAVPIDPDRMNWHQFLGAAAKAGKTMEQAAKEWKQRKAAIA